MFENKKILVLGMARSGYEAAKYLVKHGNTVILNDGGSAEKQKKEQIEELEKLGVTLIFGSHPDDLLDDTFDYLIKNPGIPIDHKYVLKARELNIEVINEAEMAYRLLPDDVTLIGITGTNGKTTVAEIIYQLLGDDCAYLGTNGRKWKGKSLSMRNTTPDVDRLYRYLTEFVNDECKELVMEASSEAFFRHRLDDIKYHIAVLTNITEDHLNIHKTLDNYIECKCQLFRQVEPDGFSILNSCDVNFTRVLASSKGTILTYGFKKTDTLYIKNYEEVANKLKITFIYKNKEYMVLSPLLGEFNVLNIAAAILVCLAKQMKIEEVLAKIENLKQIEGRLEVLPFTNKYMVMLDYAHTTDALDKILTYLNKIKKNRIITVTGSAGGREREKRPSMGKVVLEKSDYVIFTMDDPREEDVNQIIDDLLATSDLTNYERIIDRKEAIYKALAMAEDDDIVFITGKGRDNYMALGKEYLPYSDYEVIKSYFAEVAEK